jgi:Protein of unknown function (DUF2799)
MREFKCYSWLMIVGLPILISGCAVQGYGHETCNGLTSEEMGRLDGASGNPRTRVHERESECLHGGRYFNVQAYHRGEKEAIETFYCTPLHAIMVGEQGGSYSGVCNAQSEKRFKHFLRIGQRLTLLRNNLRQIKDEIQQIEEQMASNVSAPPVSYKKAKIGNQVANGKNAQNAQEEPPRQVNFQPKLPYPVIKRLNALTLQKQETVVELALLEEEVARLKRQEENINKPLPYGVDVLSERTILNAISDRRGTSTNTPPPSFLPKFPSSFSSPYMEFNTPPEEERYSPRFDSRHPGVNSYPTMMDRVPTRNMPSYTLSTVINDRSDPYPQSRNPLPPDSPDYAAREYENTTQENIHRDGQTFSLPEHNIMNEGGTVYINKDWYPR